jgi:subtilisin-like proprotein convertase family protein
MQITGDNEEGKRELDNFINPSEPYPVIATTSKLMTTGVDAQTCKLIVLDSNIGSMTEFKQIIGRGTRINEEYGKTYFTIMDFRNVTNLFADPDFDGDPVMIKQVGEYDDLDGLEDEATDDIITDVFDGEESQGVWELIVNDRSAQFGGSLQSWSLEFCSNIASNPPILVRNNNLQISEDYEKVINNSLLRVEDSNNAAFELLYTVVETPESGELLLDGVPLSIGDQFTQNDLNNFLISYKSSTTIGEVDNFLFTVIDNEGGFTGTHSFGIEFVDANVSTNDLRTINVEVYPNPVNDLLYIKTNNNFGLNANMEVYNLQGQLMIQQGIRGSVKETINTAPLGNGIYFLKIQDGDNYSISKFVVER